MTTHVRSCRNVETNTIDNEVIFPKY